MDADRPADSSTQVPAAVMVAVTVAAAAVLGVVAWSGLVDEHPKVVVIGDSITAGVDAPLRRELSGTYELTVDGRPGFTAAQQLPTARDAALRPVDQVIINLGTNDVMGSSRRLEDASLALTEMTALFPQADCIHLVTVSEQMVSLAPGSDVPGRAQELNGALVQMSATDPRVRLIDWSAAVGDWQLVHPGEVLTTDTVHPNEEGNALLVELYQDALSACPRPR